MNQPERPARRPEPLTRTRAPWTAPMASRLIRHAAQCAPADVADRLEEEWLADLATRPTALSALRFAIGCCWATQVIAHERTGTPVALAAHAGHPKLTLGHFAGDSWLFSRKPTALLTVIALHVAVFYALIVGLGINGKKLVEPPLQNVSPSQVRPKLPPLLTPPPQLIPSRIDPILPEFPPVPTGGDDPVITSNDPPRAPPQPPPSPPHVVARVQGGPGSGFPNTDDFYPSAAKRLEEQGLVAVQVCVDTHGRLTGNPTVAQSSNSPRLDLGALELARAGSGHYHPNMEDNRPVDGCYPIRIRFQLRN